MFTGIIENKALVVGIKENKKNLDFLFKTEILPQLKVDQSISHNGVCLTIAEILEDSYLVNVVNETLDKYVKGEGEIQKPSGEDPPHVDFI